MFVLKNSAGNVFKKTESEVKRDQLLAMGYKEVTEEPKQAAPKKKGNGSKAEEPKQAVAEE